MTPIIALILFLAILGVGGWLFFTDQKRRKAEAIAKLAEERARSESAKRAAAQRQAEIERAEVVRREEIQEKTEAIRHEQIEQRDQVSTGDPAADFSGSLDVLSDISAKRKRAGGRDGH